MRELLRTGAVLIVDDCESLDRTSRAIVDRCMDEGFVIRAGRRAPSNRGDAEAARACIRLKLLRDVDLRPLFAGPSALFHIPEDAARLLARNSGGAPAEIVRELGAWTRAGFARWSDGKVYVSRESLERLEISEIGPQLAVAEPDPLSSRRTGPRDEELDELRAWITMAWPFASVDLLRRATGKPRWLLEAELMELVAQGAAFLTEDRIVPRNRHGPRQHPSATWRETAHRALADALPTGHPARHLHLVAGGKPDDPAAAEEIIREALEAATRRAEEGALTRAVGALEEGMRAARRVGVRPIESGDAAETLLARWVEIALNDATAPALNCVRYEIRRTEPTTPLLSRLAVMVDAALHVHEWNARSLVALDDVQPFGELELELRRNELRLVAARHNGVEEEFLEGIKPWAQGHPDPRVRAHYVGWLGRVRYWQGRFEEAATLHLEAAALERVEITRCGRLLRAASSCVEAFEYARARDAAAQALAIAVAHRHPLLEMRAQWVLRSMQYRTHAASAHDPEFVAAVMQIGEPEWEPIVLLTEAAIAWRSGAVDVARTLASTAYDRWRSAGNKLGRLLAAGLLVATDAPPSADEMRDVVACARACRAPGVGIQTLALVTTRNVESPISGGELLALAEQVPRRHWGTRLDLLSVRESLDRLPVARHEGCGSEQALAGDQS